MRSSAIRLVFLRTLLFLLSGLFAPLSASAQDPGRIGSRILSLDSWTYEAIERLRRRRLTRSFCIWRKRGTLALRGP